MAGLEGSSQLLPLPKMASYDGGTAIQMRALTPLDYVIHIYTAEIFIFQLTRCYRGPPRREI